MGDHHYVIQCRVCETAFEDDGLLLDCPRSHDPELLSALYRTKTFEPDAAADGIYRYRHWLPIVRQLHGSGRTVTYQSERLSRVVGLPNLWVAFNGYSPEKGAELQTTTFKDLEAWTVLSRLPSDNSRVLVIASAGNTGAAFVRACSMNDIPCLVVLPEAGLNALQFPEMIKPCVKVVSLVGFTDYLDAITLANRVAALDGFFPEGGCGTWRGWTASAPPS